MKRVLWLLLVTYSVLVASILLVDIIYWYFNS